MPTPPYDTKLPKLVKPALHVSNCLVWKVNMREKTSTLHGWRQMVEKYEEAEIVWESGSDMSVRCSRLHNKTDRENNSRFYQEFVRSSYQPRWH